MSRAIAFDRPGGETAPPSRKACPLDLAHLNTQTMGDRNLQQEVLRLFSQQAGLMRGQIAAATLEERKKLAHGYKGAAAAVGAFAVAKCATDIMEHPANTAAVRRLSVLTDEVRDYIAGLTR